MHTSQDELPLEWIGSSYKDPMQLPAEVRKFAQHGIQHPSAKVLKGFGGAGVLEVVENDVGGTYRTVYTVRFEEAVFVLHCFQKKSKSGIATPKEDMDVIRVRLKGGRGRSKGDETCAPTSLTGSRSRPVLAMFLPILVCLMPISSK